MRLDRWLWAARFYKTRALAAQAVDGGKVQLNGVRAKRAKTVAPGDVLRIRKPPHEFVLIVRAVSAHRGPAAEAQRLYEEMPESRAARERLRLQLRLQPVISYEGKGRPTKKDRRSIERLKRSR